MTKRRFSTVEKKIYLTTTTRDQIDTWAAAQGVSFSAAIDTLARLGLGQAHDEAMTPAVVSVVRQEIVKSYDRFVRLLMYNIIESGTASRLAGAAVYHLYSADDPRGGAKEYDLVKEEARQDALRTFGRARISEAIHDLVSVKRERDEE